MSQGQARCFGLSPSGLCVGVWERVYVHVCVCSCVSLCVCVCDSVPVCIFLCECLSLCYVSVRVSLVYVSVCGRLYVSVFCVIYICLCALRA